jgi:MoaA/NifB/PqqE/SkfB family radical SAM enzyme
MEEILADTLALAPATVLTNGTLFTSRRIAALATLSRETRYSLELRVSLDGPDAAAHDAFRGAGNFRRALDGLLALDGAGLLPIVTVTRAPGEDPVELRRRYAGMLRDEGLAAPRLKLLPLFRLGRERERSGAARPEETLALLPAEAFDAHRLQCGSCRAVTANGVYVCPLLVDEPGGRMGDTLLEASRPFALAHSACATCWRTGMTCANG